MKKITPVLLIALFFSCTSTNKNNKNADTAIVADKPAQKQGSDTGKTSAGTPGKKSPDKKPTVKTVFAPEDFGAKGDGNTDDAAALTRAFNADKDIRFTKGKSYKIGKTVITRSRLNKVIDLNNSTIIRDPFKIGFSFEHCTRLTLKNGRIICKKALKEGSGSENCINYVACKNITTTRLQINGSAEMGIAYINCIGVTASYNNISNCYRDGIHGIYCANVQFHHNALNNIKDDALACHDYGDDSQKKFLIANGYRQACNIKIYNNTVKNTYQGVSSLSCKNLEVKANIISGTVNAGIAIAKTMAPGMGGNTTANGIRIVNNKIINSCATQKIMGVTNSNNGQNSTGRAGIFIGTLGANGQLSSDGRLQNISVINNTVTNSGVNGLWFANTDGATLNGNSFINCCIEQSNFSGTVCAIYRLTEASISNNKTIDNRAVKKHYYGFDLQNVKGKVSGLKDEGSKGGFHLLNAPALN